MRDLATTVLAAALLAWAAATTPSSAGESAREKPLSVLLLAPPLAAEKAHGYRALLEAHGLDAAVQDPNAGKGPAACDLLVVLGAGRKGAMPDPSWIEGVPVLALGSAGCAFLGTLKLKNGYPHT